MMLRFLLLLSLHLLAPDARAQEPFSLKDGDRVVFLGNGFVEQDHAFGFLESRLTRRWPSANVVFRNLGWGGDTVQGLARTSGFEQPDGMGRLLKEVQALKPTVLFVAYGMNESFAGVKGLPGFTQDYRKLLGQLAPLKAKLVLLSPTHHEDLGRPFPDPAAHNRDLQLYADAIKQIAAELKAPYIDLLQPLSEAKSRITTNGIQLNALGYSLAAQAIEKQLALPPREWAVSIDMKKKKTTASGTRVENLDAGKSAVHFHATDTSLGIDGDTMKLFVAGLPDGDFRLSIDGNTVHVASSAEWAKGVTLADSSGSKLQQAIVTKGELFYRRWRPFNDHSRHWGFIGGDFKLYDQEIESLEKTIATLRQPQTRTFDLSRKGAGR
jgi:lysophospholipase L1-like esterase